MEGYCVRKLAYIPCGDCIALRKLHYIPCSGSSTESFGRHPDTLWLICDSNSIDCSPVREIIHEVKLMDYNPYSERNNWSN